MKPYYKSKTAKIYHGDCRKVLRGIGAKTAHAVICDPPYDIGFMGRSWDQKGVAFDPRTWMRIYAAMRPGAHLVAFGGTRTFHLVTSAIMDAGFEIRDCLMWLYGQGFPKSHDVSKGIDSRKGKIRERKQPQRRIRPSPAIQAGGFGADGWAPEVDEPITAEAAAWHGWGTALKPAWEPIILARRPLSEKTVAANVLRWGTGALNIGACRIGWASEVDRDSQAGLSGYTGVEGKPSNSLSGGVDGSLNKVTVAHIQGHPQGRWPANLILSHDPRCVLVDKRKVRGIQKTAGNNTFSPGQNLPDSGYKKGTGAEYGTPETVDVYACVPGCPIRMLDEQSGYSKTPSTVVRGGSRPKGERPVDFTPHKNKQRYRCHGDSGTASRFFYTAKASTSERNAGLPDGLVNTHPTVKPVKLLRYLCRLLSPRNGLVLDPFMGSGSTGVACAQEGMRFIGIDTSRESCNIAKHRIDAAASGKRIRKRRRIRKRKIV